MEQVVGVIESLGPPTEKKRSVVVKMEGMQYPKRLRVWTNLQDGSPNPQVQQLEQAWQQQTRVRFNYLVDTWKTPTGEERKMNIIQAFEPDSSPGPDREPASEPVSVGQVVEQTSWVSHVPDDAPVVENQGGATQASDLTDLAGAIRATIATLTTVADALESASKTKSDWGAWT